MQVIGLSGYARTGKDTIARMLVETHGYERVGFADSLKELMLRLDPYVTTAGTRLSVVVGQYGWERAKDTFPEVRRLLQAHATPARDLLGDDVWVRALTRKMAPSGKYVVADVRFPNELAAVKNMSGLTVRVNRPGFGPANGHVSETALDEATFDYTIENYGPLAYLRGVAIDLAVEAARKAAA
jgi:hypothetical protein